MQKFDGVLDENDACQFVSGQGDQFGGVSGADGCPVDSDGDGIVDGLDHCPFVNGIAELNGCPPADAPLPTEPPTSISRPTMPSDGDCMIATLRDQGVNVRAFPTTESDIVGQFDPSNLYLVIARETEPSVWWRVAIGWVSDEVVRSGGNCDVVPNLEEADNSRCPALDIYTPDELGRLQAAGISRQEICFASQDSVDRVCDQVMANLSIAEIQRYGAANIRLNRLCLPEDRQDAPCPLLATLTSDQLARYEIAEVNPCGQSTSCPAVAALSPEERANAESAGADLSRLCPLILNVRSLRI